MKRVFLIFAIMISSTVFSADKQRHKDMSLLLANYVLSAQSTSPNKALVYFSSRDNIDQIDYVEVLIDNADVSDGNVEITRATTVTNGHITIKPLESCQADFGEVTIQPAKLIVFTDRLPVRVRCTGNGGEYREFYQTIFKP